MSGDADRGVMKRSEISRLHRLLRQRARLTQAELGRRAGVGRWKVVDLERQRLSRLSVDEIDRCLEALDARLDLSVRYHGAAIERLLDEGHAALVAAFLRLLHKLGWETRVEVTFNDYGERGSIDIVAWHHVRLALLVVEVKSEVGSVEGTLRPFDIKCRLAPKIVRHQFGWEPSTVGRVLILPEDRTARRIVERHRAVFDQKLPRRSRDLRRWLRNPEGTTAGIWFLTIGDRTDTKRNPSAISRVRRPRPRSGAHGAEGSSGPEAA
ncbi:MAG: XRE family transcriptional regulator [Chloroflexota bacterium]